MCYSSTASFTSAAIIAVIGVATLRQVRAPNTLLFAATPALFAIHQFSEGLVWMGLMGEISQSALHAASLFFTLYAQGLLPFLMPLAVLLMEPPGRRKQAIAVLTAIGFIAAAWDFYGLVTLPSRVFIDHHSVAYRNEMTGSLFISLLYIAATCGSLLLSSFKVVRWYGVLNVVVLSIVQLVKAYAFASVWCFYAALMSIILYWQFRQGRIGGRVAG